MHRIVSVFPGLILYLALSTAESCAAQQANPGPVPNRDAEAARVNAIELDTPYVPPPGDPLAFHAAGLVQVECSAVFVSGFAPGFASRNIGYFVSPLAEREKLGPPQVDRRQQTVSVTLPNGKVRTAKYVGDQGCVTLPEGSSDPNFKPVAVAKRSPNRKLPWPEGDGLEIPDRIPGVDLQAVAAAVDAAFDQDGGSTAAFLITWRGRIIGE
ncbi:MAG: hypothetical protein ACXWHB_06725, partial [Usitatibacter sp.]